MKRWSLLVLALLPASSRAAVVDSYALLTSTGRIGTMKVTTEGKVVDVDWRVDNNGRGPKIREHIVLGASGLPVRREIEGTATFGAPVKESFVVEGGRARWKSLDDAGEAAAGNAIYLDNRGSPWSSIQQFNVLSRAPNHARDALPGGRVRLQKLRRAQVAGRQLDAYAVWGNGLSPVFLLAERGRFAGQIAPGFVLIQESLAGRFTELSTLAGDLSRELLDATAAKLQHRIDRPIWITHARIFDPLTGSSSTGRNVVVFGRRIVGLRSDPPPPEAAVIDASGGTLLPGLIDSHAHMDDWGALLHVASGVTFVRDPGNDNETLLKLIQRIESGELIGPSITPSGFLEGKSPFSANGGFVISTQDEALEKVRWYADHGFWGIKIYNSMNPAFVKPIAAEAHRLGLHVSGHIPAFMTAEQAIRDGYDEVNHINQLLLMFVLGEKDDPRTPKRFTAIGEKLASLDLNGPPVQRLVALMKERKTTLDVTIATFAPLLQARPGMAPPTDAPWLDHVPVPVRRDRVSAGLDIPPAQYATYDASWKKMEEFLLMLYRQGIPLVPGTDDTPGLVLHSELESWVKAGIPAPAVLTAATLGGARFLGKEAERGTIAPGKLADLYLVDGDPLTNIGDIRKGRLVIKDGVLLYPDEIQAVMEIQPFARRAEVQTPKVTTSGPR
jgi:imidazolonepropionase-like amidohydrolase